MSLKKTLSNLTAKKQGLIIIDLETAQRLIRGYKRLRVFFKEEDRAKLSIFFVNFCENKINEKRFRKKVYDLKRGPRRLKESGLIKPRTKERYFWKTCKLA